MTWITSGKSKKTSGTKKTFRHTPSLRHCEFDFSVKIYWSGFPSCWNTMYTLKYVSAWLLAGFVQSDVQLSVRYA